MPTPWFRKLLMLAAFAVALLCIRPAFAYAPFCDPRAATNIAPPPFTAIPDLRWEASTSLLLQQWCERLQAARNLERDPEPSRQHFGKSNQGSWPDAASPLRALPIPRRQAATRVPIRLERSSGPPGIRIRVYRPPR